MSTYIIQVELHGAKPEDYETLHEKMEYAGYQRKIIGVSGTEYQLPDAEYRRYSKTRMSTTAIANQVHKIASSVISAPGVLVTEAASFEVIGLRASRR